jgi:ubiquinone biosynthesis protein COQ9
MEIPAAFPITEDFPKIHQSLWPFKKFMEQVLDDMNQAYGFRSSVSYISTPRSGSFW